MVNTKKHEHLFFALRVMAAFAVLAGVIVGIYFLAYRSYPAVAEWETLGSHDAIVMDGVTYRFVGTRGRDGWKKADYAIDESLGQVADDGTPVETVPETAADGTVETSVPDGDPDLSRDHTYILYSVANQEHMLIVLESDGSYALYCREVATWQETGDPSAMIYRNHTYRRIGAIGQNGLNRKDYATYKKIGLVRNDRPAVEGDAAAEHRYMIYSVKRNSHLLIVECEDGNNYLYCRADAENPPETVPNTESESAP